MQRLLFLVLMLTVMAACSPEADANLVQEVPSDYETLSAAVSAVPAGTTIRVAPGTYAEQIVIDRPLSIIAEQDGVELRGLEAGSVINIIDTNDVTIRGLTVVGGDVGISVRQSSGITIAENLVLGSRYRGVEVLNAASDIIDNDIRPAQEPYVIGIRIANALSWPWSHVSGNIVEGAGAYGIAVNFAYATVVDNTVQGGKRAGIAINEMSVANVADNTVSDVPRYGILVTDMSHAVVTHNEVFDAWEPIEIQYHSEVELKEFRHK